MNDTTVAQDEWVSGATPTYVSATSFTLVGDQTSTYHEGRRLKITDSGGTKYCTITGSAYAVLTTITVAGGALATPTSAVSYSLISAVNPSIAPEMVNRKGADVASAATCDIWNVAGDYIHLTGSTGPITSFGTAPYAGAEKAIVVDSTPTITYNATSMVINGGASVVLAAGDRLIVRADTTANMIVTVTRASGASIVTPPFPRGQLSACTLSNNAGDATNDIDFTTGQCRADSGSAVDQFNITCAAMTKQLDAGWAAGTNAGMRNSGVAIANTTYHLYAVAKADGTQDYYAHTSLTVSTVLTALQAETGGGSYLYARRIGAILREAGVIVPFVQDGDYFRRKASVLDVNTTNPGTSAVTATLSVPLGINVQAIIDVLIFAANDIDPVVHISDLASNDEAASQTAAPLGGLAANAISAAGVAAFAAARIIERTNTSAQIRYRASASDAASIVRIATLGWWDRRGRDS